MRGAIWVACGALALAGCGRPLDLPQEPDASGNPQGEVAYVRKYGWEGLGRIDDLVIAGGALLFGVEDSSRVVSWLSDTAQPVEVPELGVPETVVVDGDTLRTPVRACEGADQTLWVAYALPKPRLVQWDFGGSGVIRMPEGLVRDDSILAFGGIAADRDSGFVYVSDTGRSRITKYAPSAAGGSRVAHLSTQGNGDRFVQQPGGIFLFGDSLLVADTGKGWIQVLSADVPFSGRGQVTGPQEDPLQLSSPRDVWVDTQGSFYVADTGNARILKLASSGALREIVTEFDPDPSPAPTTVAALPEVAWVADPGRGRLVIFQLNTVSEDLP